MKSILLCIAGFTISLRTDDDTALTVEEGYLPYVQDNFSGKPDITVHAKGPVPKELVCLENIVFEARDQQKRYYTICKTGNAYKFIIYDQVINTKINQVAFLNQDFSEWIVYSEPLEKEHMLLPLQYPLGPLVMYYLTVRFDALMLHASGVDEEGAGSIFCGFSGSGKSTMAALWRYKGSSIINDDRLIIRKEQDDYFIYNTPMFYQDQPKKARLKAIHLLHHASENTLEKLTGALAVSRVLAFCIQHHYQPEFIGHHLAFLSGLCERIPVYDTGFRPELPVVDYIKLHVG